LSQFLEIAKNNRDPAGFSGKRSEEVKQDSKRERQTRFRKATPGGVETYPE